MSKLVTIYSRDYTTDGDYVDTQIITVLDSELPDYLEAILSGDNQKYGTIGYRLSKVLGLTQTLQITRKTNIMVRDYVSNKLIKWGHLC
ncbi:hypothetical protein HWB19_gp126 [Cronobacter phage vB_CsaP_009]|uniref:Uncharacterized protein n=1 Tax=Cronobacter phage vB_CsaP_009 TaxID=2699738 RepID=A0A679FI31_9CAUD|nr:hypothetical protein HWB19_gp126 [Cronobacter phage vB_CsaP_009]BBU72772.1 hypothetical protein [Cronobacter phage vB_CsaP_009]